jgi:hypothetical protein
MSTAKFPPVSSKSSSSPYMLLVAVAILILAKFSSGQVSSAK